LSNTRAEARRYDAATGVLTLSLAVHARAKRTEVAGVQGDCVKIRVAAPPVDGKANAALVRFLAGEFGVPEARVRIVRGETGPRKLVAIEGPGRRPDEAWFCA